MLGISEQTYYRWKSKYGGMKAEEAQRLAELEEENARLKKLVGQQALDLQIVREALDVAKNL
jgi:putative transposase